MEFNLVEEYCANTNRRFRVVKVTFKKSYNNDRRFLETLVKKGEELAKYVNNKAANNASMTRSKKRLIINCTAGLLAEVCWKKCVNTYYKKEFVTETKFDKPSNQIDLIILHSGKTIEVRSSFPRNGINFALCDPIYQFDVIGPYTNNVKASEPSKDFYVRTLYPINVKDFLSFLENDSVEFFLTGGADWDMMIDSDYYMVKDFIPEDSVAEEQSEYRVVPFKKALDTIEIIEKFKY